MHLYINIHVCTSITQLKISIFNTNEAAPCTKYRLVYGPQTIAVSRQLVYGHFVYDTSSIDISSTDILSSMTLTFLAEIKAGVMKRILYQYTIEPGLMQGIIPN